MGIGGRKIFKNHEFRLHPDEHNKKHDLQVLKQAEVYFSHINKESRSSSICSAAQ